MRQLVKTLRRGLNPPHRLKSISMTTFTDAEIESLRGGGNEVSNYRGKVTLHYYITILHAGVEVGHVFLSRV